MLFGTFSLAGDGLGVLDTVFIRLIYWGLHWIVIISRVTGKDGGSKDLLLCLLLMIDIVLFDKMILMGNLVFALYYLGIFCCNFHYMKIVFR
jgi:hypothetical protein